MKIDDATLTNLNLKDNDVLLIKFDNYAYCQYLSEILQKKILDRGYKNVLLLFCSSDVDISALNKDELSELGLCRINEQQMPCDGFEKRDVLQGEEENEQ